MINLPLQLIKEIDFSRWSQARILIDPCMLASWQRKINVHLNARYIHNADATPQSTFITSRLNVRMCYKFVSMKSLWFIFHSTYTEIDWNCLLGEKTWSSHPTQYVSWSAHESWETQRCQVSRLDFEKTSTTNTESSLKLFSW